MSNHQHHLTHTHFAWIRKKKCCSGDTVLHRLTSCLRNTNRERLWVRWRLWWPQKKGKGGASNWGHKVDQSWRDCEGFGKAWLITALFDFPVLNQVYLPAQCNANIHSICHITGNTRETNIAIDCNKLIKWRRSASSSSNRLELRSASQLARHLTTQLQLLNPFSKWVNELVNESIN